MRRSSALLLAIAAVAASCSSSSDGDAETTTAPVVETDPVATDPPVTDPPADTTTAPATTTSTTAAPPTTVDDAAILAEVEAAYLEAFEIGKNALRDPTNPNNEELLLRHYVGDGAEKALENLRLTIDGNFVAKEIESNPSFATILVPATFDGVDRTSATLEVCEFNSDQIFEVGAAPGGGDELRRNDPISIIFRVNMEFDDGFWRVASGGRGEELRSEEEQCSSIS